LSIWTRIPASESAAAACGEGEVAAGRHAAHATDSPSRPASPAFHAIMSSSSSISTMRADRLPSRAT
jgi:hypothetical protein